MATSPNYAWAEPDNSSLVKNGASDIRTLGDAIDTSVWNVGFGQAAKNKIINGDYAIAQRGTSFSAAHFNAGNLYTLDRWQNFWDNVPTTVTVSRESFTAGAAPVAGYEGASFYRSLITTVGSCTVWRTRQKIEDVRVFAGTTVTTSFWAKADSARSLTVTLGQNFGSGGSADAGATATTTNTFTLTTSWVRYSVTFTVPSISGKTIGTGSSLILSFLQATASGSTLDLWGVQAEYGSKMTPFQTASGGSPQAELAMCQRYYYRAGSSDSVAYAPLSNAAFSQSTTITTGAIALPVQMRVPPTSIDSSNVGFRQASGSVVGMTSVTLDTTQGSTTVATIYGTTSVIVANLPGFLVKNNNSAGYLGFSAEL